MSDERLVPVFAAIFDGDGGVRMTMRAFPHDLWATAAMIPGGCWREVPDHVLDPAAPGGKRRMTSRDVPPLASLSAPEPQA